MSKTIPKRPSTSVRITVSTYQTIARLANDMNMTIVDILEDAVNEYSKNKYRQESRGFDSVPSSELLKSIEQLIDRHRDKKPEIPVPTEQVPEQPLPDWLK